MTPGERARDRETSGDRYALLCRTHEPSVGALSVSDHVSGGQGDTLNMKLLRNAQLCIGFDLLNWENLPGQLRANKDIAKSDDEDR